MRKIGQSAVLKKLHSPPKQARSQRTLEAIYESSIKLIAEQGFEDTTIADVVSHAGISTGAFYRRFSSKQELFNFVHEEYTQRALTQVAEVTELGKYNNYNLLDIIRIIYTEIGTADEQSAKFRASVFKRCMTDDGFRERHKKLRKFAHEKYRAIFLEHIDEINHTDPHMAIDFAILSIINMNTMRYELQSMTYTSRIISAEKFTQESLHSIGLYLGLHS